MVLPRKIRGLKRVLNLLVDYPRSVGKSKRFTLGKFDAEVTLWCEGKPILRYTCVGGGCYELKVLESTAMRNQLEKEAK